MKNLPQPNEYSNQRILTSAQLAELYETDLNHIKVNFSRNKDRYVIGKHYYALEGKEKREFLNRLENVTSSKQAKILYLWTEKGALLHAKSLGTDAAWDMYERLVDDYYRLKAKEEETQSKQEVPQHKLTDLLAERAKVNTDRVPEHFFSVMSILFLHLYNLERWVQDLDAKASIEISVGIRWAQYATTVLHIPECDRVSYKHKCANGLIVDAYAYSHKWQTSFEKWLWNEYFPEKFPGYVAYRASKVTSIVKQGK